MKTALVHDYLTEFGGAERVLAVLHSMFPKAAVFTGIYNQSTINNQQLAINKEQVCAAKGLLSNLGKAATLFLPLVLESFDLRGYDVVISDGTIWSKGVLTSPEQLHIFYCHTPPRFLYNYPSEIDRRDSLIGPLLKPIDHILRLWDYSSAQRPDLIVANSKNTAGRIKKFWGREADAVIYPPVVTTSSSNNTNRSYDGENFYLYVGRLSAYKNVDVAIKACNKLKLPLKVAGTGREEDKLRQIAGPTVEMLGFVSNSELSKLYSNCKAVIFPVSEEDFGIVPVEAMSYGKPVIALRGGGAEETIIQGQTGTFFDHATVESLTRALMDFDTSKYRGEDCVAQAKQFSKENFVQQFRDLVTSHT